MSLEGKARETVPELPIENIDADGVGKIISHSDKLFLKDKLQLVYQAYDSFEKFKCPNDMFVAIYTVEFERFYNKAKSYDIALPEGILVY